MNPAATNIRQILTVFLLHDKPHVLYRTIIGNLFYAPLIDNVIDTKNKKQLILKDIKGKTVTDYLHDARIVFLGSKFVLTYTTVLEGTRHAVVATGKNINRLWVVHTTVYDGSAICVVPGYMFKKHTIAFSGSGSVDLSLIDPTGKFIEHLHQLLVPRTELVFDHRIRKPIGGIKLDIGVALFYDSSEETDDSYHVKIGLALCHTEDPSTFVCRSEEIPYWQGHFQKNGSHPECIGLFQKGHQVYIYFLQNNDLYSLVLMRPLPRFGKESQASLKLGRHDDNPILKPNKKLPWESEATFNPAVFDIDGKIHLFYRAMGPDGVSRIGYACSTNGYDLDTRLPFPVLDPHITKIKMSRELRRRIYPSGASSGGLEDPRSVILDGRVYITYTSFEGWGSIRMTVNSISLSDLDNQIWNWSKTVFMSKPGEIHKNWIIFPEKINGKYCILYSIAPKILVKFVDTLDDFGPNGLQIPRHHPVGGNLDSWDNKLRGVGPPPIKTKLGWLVLYHATEIREPNKYKLGAMILDEKNPTKILFKSPNPILEPDMDYENNWKPGVIYASGAIVRDGKLFVYYGGGDMVVALASCALDDLLSHLQTNQPFTLTKVKKYTI